MKSGRVSTKLTGKKVLHMNHTSLAIRHRRLITGHHSWQDGGRFDDRSCSQCGWFGVFSQQCLTAGRTSQSICRGARSPDLLWPRSKKSPLRTSIPNLGQVFPAWTSIPNIGQISLSSKNAREECRDRRSHSRIRNSALTARLPCSASISTMQLSFGPGPQPTCSSTSKWGGEPV